MKIKAILVLITTTVCHAVKFQIENKESGAVWVGILGNNGKPPLENGGFVLEAGQSRTIQSPEDWAGRFWPRTWCDSNTKHCLTGDCGNKIQCAGSGGDPPATLAEITLKGDKGLDYYDVSLVDGFNIPVTIEPVGAKGDGSEYSCTEAGCTRSSINRHCPNELKLNTTQGVVGCKSACAAFNTDQYCCRGAYGTPETCKPSDWPKDYADNFFKKACRDAYSYAYDDQKSSFTCKANKYVITFGV